MKILYSYRTDEEKNYITDRLSGHDVIFHNGSLDTFVGDTAGIECVSIFVNSHINSDLIVRFPNLKLIATQSTGYDHIDIASAKEKGIMVASVPAYGEKTVAEFTFALLLSISRNLFEAHERVIRNGSFSSDGLMGFDLNGKTIGVVGTGRIGKNVIRIAQGFSMNVIAFDLYPDTAFAEEMKFSYVPLERLVAESDIITLHIPGGKGTDKMIGKEQIEKMKKGVVIINTARGSLIDTEALASGLKNEIVGAAGLDVLSEEGYVDDELELLNAPHPQTDNLRTLLLNHYLIDHPHVVITPHTAFNTKEALQRILDVTCDNIIAFSKGESLNILK